LWPWSALNPVYPPGSSGSTSAMPPLAAEHTALPAAQWTEMPSKSAIAWLRFARTSAASGDDAPNTLATSGDTFSSSMLAIATAPTLHPARVNATHGAGAFLPSAVIMLGLGSVVALTTSVQYENELANASNDRLPGGVKKPKAFATD